VNTLKDLTTKPWTFARAVEQEDNWSAHRFITYLYSCLLVPFPAHLITTAVLIMPKRMAQKSCGLILRLELHTQAPHFSYSSVCVCKILDNLFDNFHRGSILVKV